MIPWIPWILGFLDSWIPGFRIPGSQITEFFDYRIPYSRIARLLNSWIHVFRIPRLPNSWISGFLDSQIFRLSCIPPPLFYCFFSLQIIEEACKKKLRKKHFVIWYFLYTKIMSVQLNNEKIIIVDFERVDDFLHKRKKQTNKLFLVIKYIK